ncbi:SMI1/KNR4 family protein [uncultured Brachyspira sp.]|uniref:SMI1/KNR4 family protein n=1 Tax=uncultured Brachyspira sp. TaxID=221953 RepID=UPI002616046E|nr:SMI1/KNR4 family protein [uncultured Brachyspira sp.]
MNKLKQKLIELNIYKDRNVTDDDIKDLETKLNLKLDNSMYVYLKDICLFSYKDKEFFGLGVKGYRNILNTTLEERELNDSFPKDCLVLQNVGVDGLLVLVNTKGQVIEWTPSGHNKIISNNLEDFLINELK